MIKATAETPHDVRIALTAGASGIGLSRTKRMLLAPGRIGHTRKLAFRASEEARQWAFAVLMPLHQSDLEALLRIFTPHPIAIRLLGPNRGVFLPFPEEIHADLLDSRANEDWEEVLALTNLRQQSVLLTKRNDCTSCRKYEPSRWYMEILRAQVVAILEAAIAVEKAGLRVELSILLPLLASEDDAQVLRTLVRTTAGPVYASTGVDIPFELGAMIELPRAAICAGAV